MQTRAGRSSSSAGSRASRHDADDDAPVLISSRLPLARALFSPAPPLSARASAQSLCVSAFVRVCKTENELSRRANFLCWREHSEENCRRRITGGAAAAAARPSRQLSGAQATGRL